MEDSVAAVWKSAPGHNQAMSSSLAFTTSAWAIRSLTRRFMSGVVLAIDGRSWVIADADGLMVAIDDVEHRGYSGFEHRGDRPDAQDGRVVLKSMAWVWTRVDGEGVGGVKGGFGRGRAAQVRSVHGDSGGGEPAEDRPAAGVCSDRGQELRVCPQRPSVRATVAGLPPGVSGWCRLPGAQSR